MKKAEKQHGTETEAKNIVKKGLCLFLAIILLFFGFYGCKAVFQTAAFIFLVKADDDRADKNDIFEFVRENEEALLQAIEDGDYSAFENKGFVNNVSIDDEVTNFCCGFAGIAPSSSEVGFYYTLDEDVTVGRGYIGGGWDANAVDEYYCEHICGNFYYYHVTS